MSFLGDILAQKSLSVVGLEKNTGKTLCLNYILKRLPAECTVAVTSIGTDGESKDIVTGTEKPEIVLREGTLFSTAEAYYARRLLLSELLEITGERSSMGRVVTARVLREGKVMLSGPSNTYALKRWVDQMEKFRPDLIIIDGALSRLSSASPVVTESMILTTGAAFSSDMETLIRRTKYIVELVGIEEADRKIKEKLVNIERGVWGINDEYELVDFHVESSLAMDKIKGDITNGCKALYVAGALTERFMGMIADSPMVKEMVLVVSDFTKIFVSELIYRNFLKRGGRLRVLRRSKLIAVCVNPLSPSGIVLDSAILCRRLREQLQVPVYDLVKEDVV